MYFLNRLNAACLALFIESEVLLISTVLCFVQEQLVTSRTFP